MLTRFFILILGKVRLTEGWKCTAGLGVGHRKVRAPLQWLEIEKTSHYKWR